MCIKQTNKWINYAGGGAGVPAVKKNRKNI